MATHIRSLTPEQEALIQPWQDKWLKIGTDTTPVNRPVAEKFLNDVLVIEQKPSNLPIIWVPNPMIMTGLTCVAKAAHNFLQIPVIDALSICYEPVAYREAGGFVTDKFTWYEDWMKAVTKTLIGLGKLTADARSEAIVNARKYSPFSPELFNRYVSLLEVHEDKTLNLLPNQYPKGTVKKCNDETVKKFLVDTITNTWYSHQTTQHWLGYQAAQSFAREVCELELPDDLEKAAVAYQGIAENLTWWFPTTAFVIVSERPSTFVIEDFDLSCRTGPAIEWVDGMRLYYVSGYMLPAHVIEDPQSQALDEMLNEENQEIKRIRIEMYGWDKFMVDTGAKVIDTQVASSLDGKTQWLEALMANEDHTILMTVDPSTGRNYALEVPQSVTTCHDAQKWLLAADQIQNFKINLEEVMPVVRT
jgi:hypothetical protein